MTAEELLVLIRRDIRQQIEMALQFKASNHFASNLKAAREVSVEVENWLDNLIKDNQLANSVDYVKSNDELVVKYLSLQRKVEAIKEMLS